ncbi:MAG: hypothetical protein HY080_06910 [Gammaproteobacteria bacterium]|nr:hypothetical protein [Gammaproteobacteria bacterium]
MLFALRSSQRFYEYRCEACAAISTRLRAITDAQSPVECATCGHSAYKILSAPQLNLMRADLRRAHQVNERSAHEPKVKQNSVYGSGCHHPQNPASKSTYKQARGVKRPWMLGIERAN